MRRSGYPTCVPASVGRLRDNDPSTVLWRRRPKTFDRSAPTRNGDRPGQASGGHQSRPKPERRRLVDEVTLSQRPRSPAVPHDFKAHPSHPAVDDLVRLHAHIGGRMRGHPKTGVADSLLFTTAPPRMAIWRRHPSRGRRCGRWAAGLAAPLVPADSLLFAGNPPGPRASATRSTSSLRRRVLRGSLKDEGAVSTCPP
jgi:hypothetical protein